MSVSASERSLIGQVGAYAQHAKYDTRETTAKARSTFMASFLDQVDPDRVLPEAERNRRADAARTAHFKRLALKSAQSRRIRSTRSAASTGTSSSLPPGTTQPAGAGSGAGRAQRGRPQPAATSDAPLEAGAGVASTSTTSTKQKRAGGHQRAS